MVSNKLQWLGLFSELTCHDSHPSLLAKVNNLNETEIGKICSYLENGSKVFTFMCWNHDVFDGESIGPEEIVSDGVWVWRSDLSHYLKKYRILLPQEFVTFVLEKIIPRLLADKEINFVWGEIMGKIPLKNDGSSAAKVGSLKELLLREMQKQGPLSENAKNEDL